MLGRVEAATDDDKGFLARIGEETLTFQDLASGLAANAKPEEIRKALEQLILQRLLVREAYQSGLASRPELQTKINDFLAREYLSSRLPPEKLAVEEGESKNYYDQHQERFRAIPMVKLAHILVASEEDAQTIRQAVQDPEAFGVLARERSLDPATAQLGGELGLVRTDQLVPGLAEAALALEPGQISGAVKTAFGYHLVKLEESPPSPYQPFAEVQQQIERELFTARHNALMRDLKQELWTKYQVVIHEDALQTASQVTKTPRERGGDAASASSIRQQTQRPAAEGSQPQLQVISAVYDLGAIPAKIITHTSLITNSGNAELIISKVHSTCRCAQATVIPTHLLPGQMGKLTVTFDPDYFKEDGRTSKAIYLESNDPEAPRRIIQLTAEIVRGHIAHEQQ